MSSSAVITEEDEGVLVVSIDRPQARNAVNAEVARGIATAMDRLDSTRELRVGIITGTGGTFCSGMDLKAYAGGEHAMIRGRGFAGLVERPPTKPLIAAIEGHALAGGFEIVLACDLVVAAEGASFGIPEARRGLVAAGGGLLRLPSRIPYHHAMELALLGDAVPAARMHEFGLVNRLVPDGEALAEAVAMARRITANAPLATAAGKRIIVESAQWAADEVWARQKEIAGPVLRSADAREGAVAFTEKRAPKWRGR